MNFNSFLKAVRHLDKSGTNVYTLAFQNCRFGIKLSLRPRSVMFIPHPTPTLSPWLAGYRTYEGKVDEDIGGCVGAHEYVCVCSCALGVHVDVRGQFARVAMACRCVHMFLFMQGHREEGL